MDYLETDVLAFFDAHASAFRYIKYSIETDKWISGSKDSSEKKPKFSFQSKSIRVSVFS